MKRLIAAFVLFAAPLSAQASPQLASEWGHRAANLHAETTDLITAIDTGAQLDVTLQFLIDIERFSSTATKLGTWIDTSEGAQDLGCIFRGMAAEGQLQLETLDTAADLTKSREALRRLATMFADAELIALASTRRSAMPNSATTAQAQSCPASAASAFAALH